MEQAGVGARLAGLRAEAAMAREQSVRAEKERDAVGRRLADLRRQETLARLAAAKQEDRGTDVVAPVDGFVLTPTLADREGAFLEPGDVVCEVSPLDTLRVEVAIDETEIGDVRPGERLRVKVLGYPDRQFQGRVSEVSWQGEIEHKGRPAVFLVRGWVENPGGLLKSGMTGRARIEVSPTTLLWRWTKGFYRVLRLAFWF
jgi:HlyD family secretion protein